MNSSISAKNSTELPFPPSLIHEERWAPAYEFEGLYEVSNLGQIRSLARTIYRSDGVVNRILGKVLQPTKTDRRGRLHLSLRKNGEYYTRQVHRMVLEAFVSPRPDGLVCCHNNGNAADNRLCNLRWDTPKANSMDACIHGTGNQGFRNPNAFLTPEQIINIRNATGTNSAVALHFGINAETARRIRKGIRWADVA